MYQQDPWCCHWLLSRCAGSDNIARGDKQRVRPDTILLAVAHVGMAVVVMRRRWVRDRRVHNHGTRRGVAGRRLVWIGVAS